MNANEIEVREYHLPDREKYKGIAVYRRRSHLPIQGYRARATIDGKWKFFTKILRDAKTAAFRYDLHIWNTGCRDTGRFNFPELFFGETEV